MAALFPACFLYKPDNIAGMDPKDTAVPCDLMTRRSFGLNMTLAAAGMLLPPGRVSSDDQPSRVAIVHGKERLAAIETVIESLGGIDCQGKDVFLKGNFNSPHPFPATTHQDALRAAAGFLKRKGCAEITLVERSGMGITTEIWRKLGIAELGEKLGIRLLALDELPAKEWRHEPLPDSHWKRGVEVPRFLGPDSLWIQICNLKTHRFGGRLSASLKNAVGLIAKRSVLEPRHNYMAELHSSPDQRLMIAEINQLFMPALSVMDATEVFTSGGPETGDRAMPGVIAASRDRVALDAVGAALLRHVTAPQQAPKGSIFEEDLLKRAADLGLGARSEEVIGLIAGDRESENLALQLKAILSQAPEDKKR